MPSLPPLDIKTNTNHAPHVVILGAGASLAAFPNGDANGRMLPLMKNVVEAVGLTELLNSHGVKENHDNFEALYDTLSAEAGNEELLFELEVKVHEYFSSLALPPEPTIYDLLLLSLREKDVIATFNWDPFLAQAVKRNRNVGRLPSILFLHGNVDVGVCLEHRSKGFLEHRCNVCKKPLEKTPLLFPVKKKDYSSNPFISAEWEALQWYMERCYLLTVFGYSAPVTDVEARSLLLEKWRRNSTRELAEVEIVDIRDRDELKANWSEFFVREHYSIFPDIRRTLSFAHVRRSCDAFAMATLQQQPWHENRFPELNTLADLHQWVSPLVQEEEGGLLTGKPCGSVEH